MNPVRAFPTNDSNPPGPGRRGTPSGMSRSGAGRLARVLLLFVVGAATIGASCFILTQLELNIRQPNIEMRVGEMTTVDIDVSAGFGDLPAVFLDFEATSRDPAIADARLVEIAPPRFGVKITCNREGETIVDLSVRASGSADISRDDGKIQVRCLPAEPVDLELVISEEDVEMLVGEMTTVEIDLLIDGSPRTRDDDVDVIASEIGNILEIRFLTSTKLKIICKNEGKGRVDVTAFHNPSGSQTTRRIDVRCLPAPKIPTPDEIQGSWMGERGARTTTGSCTPALDPTWTGGASNFGGGIVGMSGPDPDADPVVGEYNETTGEWTGKGSVVLNNGFRIETEITGKFSFDGAGNVRFDGTMTRRHFDTNDNLVCTETYPLTGQKSS